MLFHSRGSRVFCLSAAFLISIYASQLAAAGAAGSSRRDEVAIKYKSAAVPGFNLAEYETELLQCSALAAIHTWIGDNIGSDEGSEVRKTLAEDYWLDVSREYFSLAKKASGDDDLSEEIRAEIKSLTGEWRRLTETEVAPADWDGWYDLVDRCDTWRPEKAARSWYNNGRDAVAGNTGASDVAMKAH